jgi:hypothetical protein
LSLNLGNIAKATCPNFGAPMSSIPWSVALSSYWLLAGSPARIGSLPMRKKYFEAKMLGRPLSECAKARCSPQFADKSDETANRCNLCAQDGTQ